MMAVLVMLSVTSCSKVKNQEQKKDVVVRIDTVRSVGTSRTLQFPARVVPAKEVNVAFKVSGTLKRVHVSEGTRVREGQLLAEIDPIDYQVQLKATEAEYAQIKAEAERVMGLYQDGGTTASNNDKARYGLQQIEAKLEHHRNQLSYTKIYAPITGVVQKCFFDGGETVGQGMPILSMLTDGDMEVEVNLPAAAYMHRSEFCVCTCTLDILPDEVFPLKMINILPKANANQLYTMRLRFQQQNAQIAAGMSSWVTIQTCTDEAGNVLIPTTAILQADGKSFAFIYNTQSHQVHRTEVEVQSLRLDGTAEVKADMHGGDMVVSTGIHYLKDGDTVRLLEKPSRTNVGGML